MYWEFSYECLYKALFVDIPLYSQLYIATASESDQIEPWSCSVHQTNQKNK